MTDDPDESVSDGPGADPSGDDGSIIDGSPDSGSSGIEPGGSESSVTELGASALAGTEPRDEQPADTEPRDEQTASEDEESTPDRRKLLLAAVAIGILIIAGVVFALTRGGDPAPAPTTSTTSTTAAPTTTTLVSLPAGTVEVATVKASVERIDVRGVVPDEWSNSEPAVVSEAEMDLPPSSRDTAPDRPAIPTEDGPVTGRYAVGDGWQFSNPGPLEPPQPLTFLVTERRGRWVQVMIPVRPNGTVGYVDMNDVDISTTRTRLEVSLSDHTLRAFDGDELLVESPVVVGVNFSPTPTGLFYLTDIVPQTNPNGFYGPFVLATNGYSEMLNEFDNGVPVIAIHGTNNPVLMGQDKSNGCIRVPNDVIAQLAEKMPAGTPILIWP